MKALLFVIFLFGSLKSTGQVMILFSPRTQLLVNSHYGTPQKDSLHVGIDNEFGVYIYPHQKVRLKISIDEPGNKIFITDTSQKRILYTQKSSKGYFEYTTNGDKETLVIYDLLDNGHYSSFGAKDTSTTTPILLFGSGKTRVEISTTLLPMKMDTANKHFVRFLHLYPQLPDVSNFSVSLNKIPPVNIRTDPEPVDQLGEENIVTNDSTYQAIKEYINENLSLLQTDTLGLNYRSNWGCFKIVIDYRKSYYLKKNNAGFFFTGLTRYAIKHRMAERIIDRFSHRLE